MYETRPDPTTFSELVEILTQMNWNEWVENDDTGHMRHVRIANIPAGRYGLYENDKYIGCTHDVIAAAQFVAKGWEAYENGK